MVSTRLQSNSGGSNGGDGSFPSYSDIIASKGCAGGKDAKSLVPVVSTRLQNTISSGDLLPSSVDVASGKLSTVGCVTRSNTVVHNQVACHSKDNPSKSSLNLLDLPTEILQKIVAYTGFKTVANLRIVNKRMDQICGSLLNLTFNKLQNSMLTRFQSIKAQMPRRESARRQHPLACEFDIVETIYMRLNLLHCTFGKHIEKKLMYFFPGEVLDEVHRILFYIKVTPKLPRPYRVTDELFDLTTMAMEYFKEKLEPNLPEVTYCVNDLTNYSPRGTVGASSSCSTRFDDSSLAMEFAITEEEATASRSQSQMVLRKRIRKIKQGMKLYNSQLTTMKRELKSYKTKMADQQKTILAYATRLDENDKKNEEMSRKYSTLLQELNKCKTELQYWRSKSPLNPICGACGTPVATLPIEDMEALSNQGVIIPMVVVQPIDVVAAAAASVEEVAEKNELVEIGVKEAQSEVPSTKSDEPSSSSKSAEEMQTNSEEQANSESESALKGRSSKPTKRKSVSDTSQTFKRPRGVLKLRNKTIRIMK